VGNINIHIKETREKGSGPFSLGSEYGSIMGCCGHGYELPEFCIMLMLWVQLHSI
jgi:hypothetical protein